MQSTARRQNISVDNIPGANGNVDILQDTVHYLQRHQVLDYLVASATRRRMAGRSQLPSVRNELHSSGRQLQALLPEIDGRYGFFTPY